MSNHLVVDDLTVAFDSGGYVIKPLDGLSFTAEDGELVVLLGPSGCGKTTLLSCLAGLLTPTDGRIRFGSTVVNELRGPALSEYRRQTVGVVFQAFNLIASLTARGNVVVPMRLAGMPRAAAKARATELLELVGLDERGHHRPAQLSGGQQQRVAIARALVHDPPLVLADEPTAHLDHIQVEGILRLMRDLASPGRIVVVSTHDDRVSQLADRVIELAPHFSDADRQPEEVDLTAGEILFRQGERGELIYHVESGLLEVYRELADGGTEVLAKVEAGNYVGELGPILNMPRSASVRALKDTVVVGYTVRAFRKDHPAPGGRAGGDLARSVGIRQCFLNEGCSRCLASGATGEIGRAGMSGTDSAGEASAGVAGRIPARESASSARWSWRGTAGSPTWGA